MTERHTKRTRSSELKHVGQEEEGKSSEMHRKKWFSAPAFPSENWKSYGATKNFSSQPRAHIAQATIQWHIFYFPLFTGDVHRLLRNLDRPSALQTTWVLPSEGVYHQVRLPLALTFTHTSSSVTIIFSS